MQEKEKKKKLVSRWPPLPGTCCYKEPLRSSSAGAAQPPALPPPRPPCLLRRWAGRAGSARGGRGGGSGRGSLRLPAPLLLDAGGRACSHPVLSLGRASRPGWGGGKVMHAAKALAPGTGNRGPGFRRRERRRAGPTVSSAIERCRGEGTRGAGKGAAKAWNRSRALLLGGAVSVCAPVF